jgi:hypothetical protein
MKLTKKNLRMAWKYRGMLWRYRNAVRRRKQIGGLAAAAGALALGTVFWKRWNGRSIASGSVSQ